MTSAIHRLPEAQAAILAAGYDRELGRRRRHSAIGAAILVGLILVSGWVGEVDLGKLATHFGNLTDYLGRLGTLDSGASVLSDPGEWFWGITQKNKWLPLLGQTMLIAYIGTVSGAIGGTIVSLFAARNLSPSPWLGWAARRIAEFCRTVPDLVFALIFVQAFHLGPLPGILALAIHSTGALGKLFAEVVENIDMKPVEGLAATGAGWLQTIRFGVLPQVLANFASYTLLRFEINVRTAGIIGFVGAGGIGQELLVSIRKFYYSDVSALLMLLIASVVAIDLASEWLRRRLVSASATP